MFSPDARGHWAELRRRVLRVALVALLAGAGVYLFKQEILAWLLLPLQQGGLGNAGLPVTAITTGVGEQFFIYLKLAGWGGVLLALPQAVWEVWRFIQPGLHRHERKLAGGLLLAAPLLFYAGAAFALLLMVPLAVGWLLGFSQPGVVEQPALRDYVGFVLMALLAGGGAFLSPLILLLLMRLGVVTPAQLAQGRRWIVVAIFVVAAVLTPPDPVSQILLALPLWLLFEGAVATGRALKLGAKVR